MSVTADSVLFSLLLFSVTVESFSLLSSAVFPVELSVFSSVAVCAACVLPSFVSVPFITFIPQFKVQRTLKWSPGTIGNVEMTTPMITAAVNAPKFFFRKILLIPKTAKETHKKNAMMVT